MSNTFRIQNEQIYKLTTSNVATVEPQTSKCKRIQFEYYNSELFKCARVAKKNNFFLLQIIINSAQTWINVFHPPNLYTK